MKLSVKSDYATRAVLGLARRYPAQAPCRVEELAAEQQVPPKYLVQILIELKARQIVRSQRGKEGGYALARSPSEITVGDVLRAVEGALFDTPARQDGGCPAELRRVWEALGHALEHTAGQFTFQRLLDEATERQQMYHI